MKITRKRKRIETTTYHRIFDRKASPSSGFIFDCNVQGEVDRSKLNPIALESFEECLAGTNDTEDAGVETYRSSYIEPAQGICDNCGETVTLSGFTNACDCGADYNMSGQRLAPREQWGEETGESVQDILDIDIRTPKENLDV